ncbi:MAG: TIGR00341 family protein, partial [Duncaniella sp.]|nr:TIGR00341 family protein [Duncaniella sp.]
MASLKNYLIQYFSMTDDLLPQAEAEAAIREGVSFKGTNLLILVLAIFIASLGLNTNSTAVIIGAMLISPLMGPIIGIGLGVGVQDFDLLKRCLRNLLMAAGFSMLTSTIYFLISPVSEGHSELLARTSPTIYDVLIGFFGGGAGIVAIGSKSKGNVIPGVAIATALMPPLCTAGYGLATMQMNYFVGATYLFLINSIFIALSTFIGVKLMHYRPVVSGNPERSRKVRHIVYTVSILTLL